MSLTSEGFLVVTTACETHVKFTVSELPGNHREPNSVLEKCRREDYFLEFFTALEAYVRSANIEERLGLPVVFDIPREYHYLFL